MFRRLMILPLAMILANFLGFAYSLLARYFHELQNPFGSSMEAPTPIWNAYLSYIQGVSHLDFGNMPLTGGKTMPVSEAIGNATLASLGLLTLAYLLSRLFGLALGFWATRNEPPEVRGWLGGALTPGRLYVTTSAGNLYAIGESSETITQTETTQPMVTPLARVYWYYFPVMG